MPPAPRSPPPPASACGHRTSRRSAPSARASPGSKSTARTTTPTAAPRSPRSTASAATIRCRCTASACRSARPIRSTRSTSRKLKRLDRPHRARARLRAPVLERRRRAAPERPPAAAVHRGGARPRVPARRRSPGRARAASCSSRTSRRTSRSPTRRFPNGSSSPRSRGAPAASCCSTSTTSTSTPSTTASTPTPISRRFPADAVAEIHLAGFDASGPCLIDTHGAPVAPDVWALYGRAIERFGPRPTLIEWDIDIPPFATLLREAATAQSIWRPAMPSLRELQQQLRRRRASPDDARAGVRDRRDRRPRPIASRSTATRCSPTTAMRCGATYPVVLRLVGAPFFNAAVDAFVHAHPSTSGDLNVYGDAFGDFLAGYPHAGEPALSARRRAPRVGDRRGAARGRCRARAPRRCWRRWRRCRRSGCRRCGCASIRRAGWSRRSFRSCASGR